MGTITAQTLFDKLCTEPNPDPMSPYFGKTPGEIFSETLTDVIDDFDQIPAVKGE